MKTVRNIFWLFAAGFALAVLGSCDTDGNKSNPPPGAGEIKVTVSSEIKYYSLSTGKEVTDNSAIASKDWDIGFQRTRTILTNSGDTAGALNSGGQGNVRYTNKTDFAAVVQSDAVTTDAELEAYIMDRHRDVTVMSATSQYTLNVINFPGYQTGTGTKSDPFKTLEYNKQQFYKRGSASDYPVTGVVYIVKHGDGVHYSKIRVKDYEYNSSAASDTFIVEYENF